MEIVERGNQRIPPSKKRPETQKTGRFFLPDDMLEARDCKSFDTKDYGQRLIIHEGVFRPVGKVWGDIGNGPKFLSLLVPVSADKNSSGKHYLYDDGDIIHQLNPDEIEEVDSYRIEPGTPKLIPIHFLQESQESQRQWPAAI